MQAFARLGPAAKAIILMILAMFVMTLMDSLAKEMSTRYHTLQVVWARFASQAFLSLLIFAPRLHILLRTRYIGMQLVRSFFLFSATIFFFFGIAELPLATAAAIFEVGPLIITVAAYFVLKERFGPKRLIGVLAGFIGALIIIRPGTSVFTMAALLPLGAACSYAGYAVSTRMLRAEETPWTSFLYTALLGTAGASLLVPFYWETPTLVDGFLFLSLGAIAGVGHLLLIRSLSTGEISMVAPFGYFGLLFNGLWGVLFFAEIPGAFTVFGSLVIVGAGLYVWWRETKLNKPVETPPGTIGNL